MKYVPIPPSLTEELIMNYDFLPPHMQEYRRFRIEYGFQDASPEGLIYLPPNVDPREVEKLIRGT
tara:strand:+ start:442 stop:636 length:195 start_codon:yes stop_codon:yes gene_type:complete